MTRWTLLALAAVVMACNQPPSGQAPTGASGGVAMKAEEIGKRVEEYFSKSVTPGIGLKATGIAPSDVPGWNKGTLEVKAGDNEQSIPFLVTPDGKFFISGEVTDLTVDPLVATMQKIDVKGRPARGPADAKVTIVEYSDFQCPFCSRGYSVIEDEVLPAYGDKVRFYFKHLPLKSIHPWAEGAALATECAAQQSPEGFWALYNAIFKNQKEINQDNLKAKVTEYAKAAGLDETKFTQCYDTRAAIAQVDKDLAEAETVGAQSTPTFFINGRRLEGAQPLDAFKAVIDAELAG